MKKNLIITLFATLILIMTGCSSSSLKAEYTVTGYEEVIGADPKATEFEYQIKITGSESDLSGLQLKTVAISSGISSMNPIIIAPTGEAQVDKINNTPIYIVTGEATLHTTDLSKDELEQIKLVDSVTVVTANDKTIELKIK